MGGALERVNKGLEKIKTITGWGLVKVEKDFSITYEGRPPELIAASERARINYSMQAVFALMTESGFLAFHAIDILNGSAFDGLFNLVEAVWGQRPEMRIVLDGTSIGFKAPRRLNFNTIMID